MKEKTIIMLSSADYTTSSRYTRIARIFSEENNHVILYCCDRDNKYKGTKTLNKIEIILPHSSLANSELNFLSLPVFLIHFYIKIILYFIRNISQIDIIYSYTFDTLIPGIILKKIYNAKLIYDSAEYYPGIVVNHAPYFLYLIIRALYFRLSKKADYILTTNEWTKFQFTHVGDHNISVIPNVPNTDLFHFDRHMREEIRKSLGINMEIVLFSFIGYIGTYRGLENIVKAIKILSKERHNFRFLLIGRGPLKHKLIKMMKKENLMKYLIVKDFIPLENVSHYLSASDVIFSLYDPIELNNWYAVPNKLFEAAACKRPVIAGNFGHLKKLVLEMNCGLLVDPNDPIDIAEKMSDLIVNPDLRKKLGKNGLMAIKQKYNLSIVSKILRKLLHKLN